MSISLGTHCASISSQMVRRFGEDVVITRRPSVVGGPPTVTTVKSMAQHLGMAGVVGIRLEADLNINETEGHLFIFETDADIKEAIDTITHGGVQYRVATQGEHAISGDTAILWAVGVRV